MIMLLYSMQQQNRDSNELVRGFRQWKERFYIQKISPGFLLSTRASLVSKQVSLAANCNVKRYERKLTGMSINGSIKQVR